MAIEGTRQSTHLLLDPRLIATLVVDSTPRVATEVEPRVLIEEFVEGITVLPHYFSVKAHGAPPVLVVYPKLG
jgi:hypothetical protein